MREGLRADPVPVHGHLGGGEEEVQQDAQHLKVAQHGQPGRSRHIGTWAGAAADQGNILKVQLPGLAF